MLVCSESFLCCGADARAQGLLLLAGNLDDALGGSLLLGSQLEELVDEVGVFLGGRESTALLTTLRNLNDFLGVVLGNLLVDLLRLLSGVLGGMVCFVGCVVSLVSGVFSFLGQFLGSGLGSSLLSSDLSLGSQMLSFSGLMGSSLGGMLSVFLGLLQCLSLQFGEGLLARLLALGLASGNSGSLGSSHGYLGEVLGLSLDLNCLLLAGNDLRFLGRLLSSLLLNLLGLGRSFLESLLSFSLDLLHGSSGSGLLGFSSSSRLISSGLSSEESLSLLGIGFGNELLHLLLESGLLCLLDGLL